MTIREAKPADAEAIITFVHRLDAEPESMIPRAPGEFRVTVEEERQLLADYAAGENSLYLVAEAAGHLVGILSCSGGSRLATRHCVSFGMSVAKEMRNRGVGSALLEHLIEWAWGTDTISRIELEVYAHNAPAIHLYRKFGFVEEGKRKRAYFQHGQWIDGVMMALLLTPDADAVKRNN